MQAYTRKKTGRNLLYQECDKYVTICNDENKTCAVI